MSSIAITLEMMLAMLLAAALLVGLKLERRLKALREDQAGFGKAIEELNGAILRAEGGLSDLKTATLVAQTTLADHMQDAKAAAARLQQQTGKATETIERLETALARAPVPAPTAQTAEPDVLSLTTPIRDIRDRLALARRPAPEGARSRADLLQSRLPDPGRDPGDEQRSRVRVDDDLFEAPAPSLKLAAGARR